MERETGLETPSATNPVLFTYRLAKMGRRARPSQPSVPDATGLALDEDGSPAFQHLLGVFAAHTSTQDKLDALHLPRRRRAEYADDRQDPCLAVAEAHAQLRLPAEEVGRQPLFGAAAVADEAVHGRRGPSAGFATAFHVGAAAGRYTAGSSHQMANPRHGDGRPIRGHRGIGRRR